jgi:hypothetical protein
MHAVWALVLVVVGSVADEFGASNVSFFMI